jgi:hypothetical protein
LSSTASSFGRAAFQSLSEAAKEEARKGTESMPYNGFSLACAEISRSPIGACPVCTARLMSLPLNSEPPGCSAISILPPVAVLTQAAKSLAFSEWKLVAG